MAIQHRDITGNNIHEPKGVDTAPAGLVYVSSGTGSGSWTQIPSSGIKGLPGGVPIANQVLTTDGMGGFRLGSTPLYGSLTMATTSLYNLTTTFATPPLSPSLGALSGMSAAGRGLRVSIGGVYKVTTQCSTKFSWSSSPFTRTATYRLRRNGAELLAFNQQSVGNSGGAAGTVFNFTIDTYITLNANDYLEPGMYIDNIAGNARAWAPTFTFAMQLVR